MELMERRRILLNTPHINIVTGFQFVTDMVAPIESLVINFSPIQDLHGYDNPWPAGGGKNLLPPTPNTQSLNQVTVVPNSDGSLTFSGTSSIATSIIFADFSLPAGTYYFSNYGSINTTGNAMLYIRDIEGASTLASFYLNATNQDKTFTLAQETNIRFYTVIGAGVTVGGTLYPMVRASGDTTYAPYSNVCPISGWTGVNVVACGVNVWDEEWEVGGINKTTGEPEPSNQFIRSKNFIRVAPSTQYYMTFSGGYRYAYDENKNYIGTINLANPTPSNCHYMKFRLTTQYGTTYNHDVSINCPSTDHDYHPYVGTSVNIDWTDEAGTVYGGTLNVITGVLTVTHAIIDLGTLTWSVNASDSNKQDFLSTSLASVVKRVDEYTLPNAICSIFVAQVRNAQAGNPTSNYNTIGVTVSGNLRVLTAPNTYTDATAFKTAMNGVQLCYELATPITVQLTPQQIRTVKGTNNLFSNSNGEVTVNYWTHLD